MFGSSTQKNKWLFKDTAELIGLRKQANNDYIKRQNYLHLHICIYI